MDQFTKHYPDPEHLEDSAYYYWHRFMQLVDGYGHKHPLWKDFGDVHKLSFWDWWNERGESLFMTGLKDGVEELKNDLQVQQARKDGAFILRVDTGCTRKYLVEWFNDFLDKKKIGDRPGRKKHKDEMQFAKYPFHQRPNVKTLKIILDVWGMRNSRSGIEPPILYEIGVQLRLNPGAVILEGDDHDAASQKRNKMDVTVSRYDRWGRKIIENIAKGVFPKIK